MIVSGCKLNVFNSNWDEFYARLRLEKLYLRIFPTDNIYTVLFCSKVSSLSWHESALNQYSQEKENVQFLEHLIEDAHKQDSVRGCAFVYVANTRFRKRRRKNSSTCCNNIPDELGLERAPRIGTYYYSFAILWREFLQWNLLHFSIPDSFECPAKDKDAKQMLSETRPRAALKMKIEGTFMSMYLVSAWTTSLTTRAFVTVTILLLSGVRKGAFEEHMHWLDVIDVGSILQLRAAWPAEMTDVPCLHTLWLVVLKGNGVSEHHS